MSHANYLRDWAADIRKHNGRSVDADRLDDIAAEIERLRTALAPFAAFYDRPWCVIGINDINLADVLRARNALGIEP